MDWFLGWLRHRRGLVIFVCFAGLAAAFLLGIVVDPSPGWAGRAAVWVTIAAAFVGLLAILLALAAPGSERVDQREIKAIEALESESESSDIESDIEGEDAEEFDPPPGILFKRRYARAVKNLPGFLSWRSPAIPIYVLADIVDWWREEQEKGNQPVPKPGKRWRIADIEHAIRKDVKQGAPAWFVKFAQDESYYRVPPGGRSRRDDRERTNAVSRKKFDEIN